MPLGGTTYGMAEETLAFYPLIIAALIALGYDALTGVAVIMLGAGIGVLGSTINPFATGIASGFAGIPLGDGHCACASSFWSSARRWASGTSCAMPTR